MSVEEATIHHFLLSSSASATMLLPGQDKPAPSGPHTRRTLLQMEQAYIAVLNQAGASLLLKYTRMRSQGQADHCLRLRPAPCAHTFPIPYRTVFSFSVRCNRSFLSRQYRAVSPPAPAQSPLFHR